MHPQKAQMAVGQNENPWGLGDLRFWTMLSFTNVLFFHEPYLIQIDQAIKAYKNHPKSKQNWANDVNLCLDLPSRSLDKNNE